MEIRKTTALASFVTSISLFWVGFVEFASAQASCQGTVDGVATEMRRKGTRVEVLVHPWGDSQEDSLENTKRVGHVAFGLGGIADSSPGHSVANNVLHSAVLNDRLFPSYFC
jgi:hypothetical protein